ncbi:phosphatase PAP2 family protein [Prosthecochloris sp. HL-130-GSB]|jgi:membrane-associated phospholipid phosphatase|uniref:Phosphatase PAP2 family protein n=1 Tax=Prosthecochloris aestuarii TaxID=1102 RepID=A0A831STD7_PROAE|nr:phosphatase PAP2 family protein [Prosthecochloris sp. HL-130-GSB]ARM30538.1 phosphatase PAP2 family protein [Prosthecochloris sp. HL-130-GSB]MBO8093419.1 phosphatase PAP2 family protein [Prosthecochloris sp.]HED30688.1 phosphatase PAP2 family protein [Prosthecochloris aestuarii]
MKNHDRYILTAMLVALICVISYHWIDRPVTEMFLSLRGTWLTAIFKQLTRLGESQWYLAGGLLLWLRYRKSDPTLSSGGLLLFSSVALSGIAANIAKSILGRARPRLYDHHDIFGFDFFHIDYAWLSFPSGHSATAFSAASALALMFPRYRVICYCAAALVASSRVILAQHWVSDIVAGSFLGLMTTLLLYHKHFRRSMHEQPV